MKWTNFSLEMDWAWVKHLQDERGRKGLNGLAHIGCGLCRSGEYPTCISCRLRYLTRFKKEWVGYRLTQFMSTGPNPTRVPPWPIIARLQIKGKTLSFEFLWNGLVQLKYFAVVSLLLLLLNGLRWLIFHLYIPFNTC